MRPQETTPHDEENYVVVNAGDCVSLIEARRLYKASCTRIGVKCDQLEIFDNRSAPCHRLVDARRSIRVRDCDVATWVRHKEICDTPRAWT